MIALTIFLFAWSVLWLVASVVVTYSFDSPRCNRIKLCFHPVAWTLVDMLSAGYLVGFIVYCAR